MTTAPSADLFPGATTPQPTTTASISGVGGGNQYISHTSWHPKIGEIYIAPDDEHVLISYTKFKQGAHLATKSTPLAEHIFCHECK